MRARVYSNGGSSTGGFTFNGGQLTGALILAGNPSELLEAAAKQYVDSSLVNLNASNLTSGTLPSGRLPVFTGDIVKPAGSSTINLAPTGIVAGEYTKPTVDAKGRITGGSTLTEQDIPNLSWNKITSNKPTTLNGYGITDGVNLSGSTLTGFLSFAGSITSNMQAVTKQYVDVTLSSSSGIAIGDIIRKPYTTTPPGFLKCNGAEVDKTTYNALYSVINDRFSKQKHVTSGRPWQQQYTINETQTNNISNWTTGTSLPANISVSQAIVTKNRVYLLGGFIAGSGVISNVYTATINNDGTLNAWTAGTSLPGVLCYSQVTIIKNRVYLFGGSTNGNNSVSTVYTAIINADGTLGTWNTTTALPGAVSNVHLIVTTTKIYLAGGNSGVSYVSTVYVANINSDGTLGAWTTDTALPEGFYCGATVITKNRVYICGGRNSSTVFSKIYTATINSDGSLGTWVLSNTSLPTAVWTASPFVTKNRVYLIGGTNSSGNPVSDVLTAPINADGTLGTWTMGNSMPGTLAQTYTIATKNRLFTLGGYGISNVYSAVISGGLNDYSSYYAADDTNYLMPGSGKPWQHQYQINNSQQSPDITGWVSGTAMPGITAHASVIVTKNRVYVIGGRNASVYLNTVYTAPINSDGTLGTWTTDTPFPVNIASAQVFVTKNKAYLVGGFNGTTYLKTSYTAVINADGTLGTWNASSIDTTVPLSGSGSLTLPIGTTSMSATGKGGSGTTTITPGQPYIAPTYQIVWAGAGNGGWDIIGDFPSNQGYPAYPGGADPAVPATAGVEYIGPYVQNYISGSNVYRVLRRHLISQSQMVSPGQPYIAPSESYTTGASSTITVNGVTYTSPGGYGGAATQTTNNATFPGTATIPVSYNIAAGGSGSITYTVGNSLPYSVAVSQAVVTRDRVYLLGGYINGAYSSATYHATIDSNGVIGTWVAGLNLPVACAYSQAVITKNRIYLLGGTPNGSSATSTIYVSTISNDGIIGPWTTASPSLPGAVFGGQMFVSKNTVYLISGTNGSSNVTTIYYAQINSDGTIGTWMTGATLPFSGYYHSVFVTSSKIYSVGGIISSAYSAAVWSAPILGGINDYSPYYDGTITQAVIVDPTTTFALPDLTNGEKFDTVSYIKY